MGNGKIHNQKRKMIYRLTGVLVLMLALFVGMAQTVAADNMVSYMQLMMGRC